ncbi:MAG: flagellar protein FlgN [Firmicutes bacterium]|nr:flagellar protein FlgN [Bacillota bacterium]
MDPLVEQMEIGLSEMLDLYHELLDLSIAMAKHLESDDWEAVNEVLCAKEAITGKIDNGQARVEELRTDLERHLELEVFSVSALEEHFHAPELSHILNQLMDVIQQIQATDGDNERRLRQMVANVQLQMDDLQKGQKAAKAYQPNPPLQGNARFVDEKK